MSEESGVDSQGVADDTAGSVEEADDESAVDAADSGGQGVPFGLGIVGGAVLGIATGLLAGNFSLWVGVGIGIGAGLDLANRLGMLGLQPDDADEE